MSDRTDVVIVGAGLMGAATAWACARRGLSALVLDQFPPGHRRGSSHGSARIVRRAYGDALYTDLSGRAFELWRELEAQTGTPLLRMLGGIDFGSRRDAAAIAARLAAAGAAHEILHASDAEQRWPGMRFAGNVVYHPQAGTLDADAAVTAFLADASRHGAQLRIDRVVSLRESGGSVAVRLASGAGVQAGQIVVAAGAWAAPLLEGVVELPPLRVTQQHVLHFPRRDTTAPPWPSVIHDDARGVYHLAGGRDGGPGDDRKIGEHDPGTGVTPDGRDGQVDAVARARVVAYVERWLPGLVPQPGRETTCLYTSTPSEDFILDRLGRIVVCSPCSGHGAKFAPLIGELAAGLVIGDAQPPAQFRLASHAIAGRGGVSL